jgi:ribonuclease P protein component
VSFVAGEARGEPPRVAYAVGRRIGPAVTRNRVRRRLRAAVAEHRDLLVADGAYLVIPHPGVGEVPYAELSRSLAEALGALPRSAPRRAGDGARGCAGETSGARGSAP